MRGDPLFCVVEMSRNLLHILTDVLKIINVAPTGKHGGFDTSFYTTLLFGTAGLHSLYTYGTSTTEDITVVNKYDMVNHGHTRFMIYDDKGRHYAVNNSYWYWKWDSVEDWTAIKKGDRIQVKYYGIRAPLFGVFPNIVSTKLNLDAP